MIPILYEDNTIIVVNKPSNMPSQKDFSRDLDMQTSVETYLGEKVFLIHRLDRHVSGPVVLAKTRDMANRLNLQLTTTGFDKNYLAVVKGEAKDSDTLIHYLKKEKEVALTLSEDAFISLSEPIQKNYKKAELYYECNKRISFQGEVLSLLYIKLITGRFHQIRAQLSYIGYPIIGDPKYGITRICDKYYKMIGLQEVSLGILHPKTGKKMIFESYHHQEPFDLFKIE